MKNNFNFILLILLVVYVTPIYSATRTWTGLSNTSWTNSGNWSGTTIPTSSDDVVINSTGTNRPATNISGTIKSLTMNSGSGTLTLTGNMTISGALTLKGGSLNVNGKTLTIADIVLTSGTLALGGTALSPSGNLTLSGGTFDMGGATVNLGGNITVTANSTVKSTGVSMLNATGKTLTINGGKLLLDNIELVIDNLTFTSSHIINESNGGFLSFDASQNHTLTSVDNSSHVKSKVRLYTANGNGNTFLFPIGDGTVYAPFVINPTNVPNNGTSFTHYFEATYYGVPSPNKTLDLSTLNSASGYEYWTANASSTGVNGTIGLRYDNNSAKTGLSVLNSVLNISTDLILAQYISSKWSGIASGNSTASGITTVLSTSTAISPNTSYTLASNNSRSGFMVALPVVLLNFNAVANQSKTVTVTWSAVKEEFNKYFEVLRSSDGLNWKPIGKVPSTGSGKEVSNYSITDYQPYSLNYYRLKEVAINGDFTYSDMKMVRINESVAKISCYPNPANQNLNVSFPNADFMDAVSIQLVNQMGQIVLVNTVDNISAGTFHTTIDIANLPEGVYLLTIKGNNWGQTYKIMIQH